MHLRSLGRWLLVPASVIFALRALLATMGDDPSDIPGLGSATGVSGALALPGIVLVWWASRRIDGHGIALAGLVAVLVGHFGLSHLHEDVGAAFVYLGSGLAAAQPLGVAAGGLALVGALLRGDHTIGHVAVALGAAGTAAALALAARRKM